MELKHARNAIEIALLSVGFDDEIGGNPRSGRSGLPAGASAKEGQDPIVALASLHRVLDANKGTAKARTDKDQFLLRLS